MVASAPRAERRTYLEEAYGLRAVAENIEAALREIKADFGGNYPLLINGERHTSQKTSRSINPSNPAEIISLPGAADRNGRQPAEVTAE